MQDILSAINGLATLIETKVNGTSAPVDLTGVNAKLDALAADIKEIRALEAPADALAQTAAPVADAGSASGQ